MKKLLIFILLIINSIYLFGQRGFYATDSSKYVGIKLIDGGSKQNAKICKIQRGNEVITFTPEQIKEYGFEKGKTYISKQITLENDQKLVFLEKINQGDIDLYYYIDKEGKRFFIEKDSSVLVELVNKIYSGEAKQYREILLQNSDNCKISKNEIKQVSYNKIALSNFVDFVNTCNKPFPHREYGVYFGINSSKLTNTNILESYLGKTKYKYDYSLIFGLFLDLPIYCGNFSFHPEIYFQKNAFSLHNETEYEINDVIINTSIINLPIMLRYTHPFTLLRPYINFGINLSYNYNNTYELYQTTKGNNLMEINEVYELNIYSKKHLSYIAGFGLMYRIDDRKSILNEIRLTQQYINNQNIIGNFSVQYLVGIIF